MEELGFRVTHIYGMTELQGPSTLCVPQDDWAALPLEERAALTARQGVRYAVVEGQMVADPRSMKPVPRDGKTMGEIMIRGNTVMLGYLKEAKATAAERRGDGYALRFEDGTELRGEKLLVATGRRARTEGLGLESAGIEPDEKGNVEVDERLRAGDAVWAVGDVTGTMLFTHLGKYQARVAAADILGRETRADYRAVPRVVFTDPQVAAVGEPGGERQANTSLESVARTSTYTREYDERPGFLTLFADGDRLVGAVAVGPEAGEWLQQATLAIRAEVPIDTLRQVIQPYPTFSEAFVSALADLDA